MVQGVLSPVCLRWLVAFSKVGKVRLLLCPSKRVLFSRASLCGLSSYLSFPGDSGGVLLFKSQRGQVVRQYMCCCLLSFQAVWGGGAQVKVSVQSPAGAAKECRLQI